MELLQYSVGTISIAVGSTAFFTRMIIVSFFEGQQVAFRMEGHEGAGVSTGPTTIGAGGSFAGRACHFERWVLPELETTTATGDGVMRFGLGTKLAHGRKI